MFGGLWEVIYGGAWLSDRELLHVDPREAAHLLSRQKTVTRSLIRLGLALPLLVVTLIASLQADGNAVADLSFALGFGVFTAALGGYFSARRGRQEDAEQVLTLGSIFLQEPQVLRRLLDSEAIDGFIKNLLRTVLRDDDLGDSMWLQAVAPLVHRLDTQSHRYNQRYAVTLTPLDTDLVMPLAGGERLALSAIDHRQLQTRIRYRRAFAPPPDAVWLGVVFDPERGPSWFQAKDFVLREYMPLDSDAVDMICNTAVAPPALSDGPRSRGIGRLPRALAARRQLGARLEFAEALCQPSLTIAGSALKPDEVGLDQRGIAVRYPLGKQLRDRLESDPWAEVEAGLCFAHPKKVSTFPVYFPDLTRGAEVIFDHRAVALEDVQTDLFFSVYRPFASDVDRRPGREAVVTADNEWVFPGSGMVFSWTTPRADQAPVR